MLRFALAFAGWFYLAFTAAWAGLVLSTAADSKLASEPRLALVIAAGDYNHVPALRTSLDDARLITRQLGRLGFDSQVVDNPDMEDLEAAIDAHLEALKENGRSVSLVYFTGHGFELDGALHLLAVNARPDSQQSLMARSVELSSLAERIVEANHGGESFFFIDSSRNNPFSGNPPESGESFAYANSSFLFATERGHVAMEGDGENSPFALALWKALATPNLDHMELYRMVRLEVSGATQGAQMPAWEDTLRTSVVLNPDVEPSPEDDPGSRAAKAIYEKEPGIFAPTYEDGSYALLVGVGDYEEIDGYQAWRDLPSVPDDIAKLEDVLETLHGFTVETLLDPTGDELQKSLESFVNRYGAKSNARLLIYLAGHGTTTETFGRKTAWFVPADAPAMDPPAPFRNSALNLRRVEEWSETVDAKHVMWIFDSCFSGAAIKMIETRSQRTDDGWSAHLHANPVRRVLTAGSENEEVPAESVFTRRLVDVLSGKTGIGENGMVTGRQIGDFLREDIIRYNYRLGLRKVTPQSDTIVIPGEEGDIIFRIEPQLVAEWENDTGLRQ